MLKLETSVKSSIIFNMQKLALISCDESVNHEGMIEWRGDNDYEIGTSWKFTAALLLLHLTYLLEITEHQQKIYDRY